MDAYTWEAKYKDGSLIQEWAGAKYKDINRKNLQTFTVYQADDLTTPVIKVDIQPGQQLIWRKRRLNHSLLGLIQTTFIAGWINDDECYATFIERNELLGKDVKRYETGDFHVAMFDFEKQQ